MLLFSYRFKFHEITNAVLKFCKLLGCFAKI